LNIALFVVLAALLIFLIGVLTGSGMNTRAQDARDRRQAATQRRINDQWRALEESNDLQ
jgi:hypothetical protein